MSKTYGWSKIRFFAVDRKEGQPLKRVLLTIEDTNDEKRELERFERQTSQMELENSVKSTFIAGSSNAMRPSVQAIDDLAITIAGKADDDAIRSYANEIRSRGKLLTHLIDNVIDSLGVGDNVIQAKPEEYSLSETISEACDIAETIAIKESFKVEVEVSPAIPARLVGDARRIERVLIGIFTYMTHLERTEAIRLSAYGALNGSGVHILFSIKADGSGVSEKEAREFAEFVDNMESYGTKVVDDDLRELEGVALVLMLMGSKLRMVNEPGENLELYFELEQGIVDNPPAFGGNDGDE